jgi:threonine/homoserine/homoserine lactone efflux protein
VSLAFLLTALVVVVTPGTGVLLTISAGISRGVRAGVITAVGCTLGIVPHLVAAVSGTAALLRVGGIAFEVLRVAGIAYLVLLAVMTWRDRTPVAIQATPRRSAPRTIAWAVLANLLNPKLTIFFFAFVPQFVPAHSAHQLRSMLVLSAVFMLMTLAVFVLYGTLAAVMRQRLVEHPAVVRRMRKLFAASFVGLGVKLASATR